MSATFRMVDRGYKSIKKELRKLGSMSTSVGVFDDAGSYPTGEAVVDVALWNEMGTKNIPARPFIQSATMERKNDIADTMQEEIGEILDDNRKAKEALSNVGEKVKDLIVNKIDTLSSPPLAPATIRKKGHSKPLIDTRKLRESITHKEA